MTNITYLFGAGASANTIPIVSDFNGRMYELRQYLESCLPATTLISKPFIVERKYVSTLEGIIKDFDWLIKQAGNYFTIDTLAKKFYLTDQSDKLVRLKKCLVTYFTLEQYIFVDSHPKGDYKFQKAEIDKRYDSFIAAIAKKNPDNTGSSSIEDSWMKLILNDNIKILSWNYDIQFERSLNRFLDLRKKIHFIKSKFQIFPNKDSMYETDDTLLDTSRFSMVKLNGNAIWDEFVSQPLENIPTIYDSYNDERENKILLEFYLDKYVYAFPNPNGNKNNDSLDYFNFAWENDRKFREKYIGHDKNLEMAQMIASDTEVLVVIGYSFPIFNREIDNRLFNAMVNLKKVYIQDKNPDRIMSTMVNAFSILQETEFSETNIAHTNKPKITILKEQYTDQFAIPYELNQ